MTGTVKDGDVATPGGELADEEVRPEETRSARTDVEPSTSGGKATATDEQIMRRAVDTITDDEGYHLEPPD